MKIRNTNITIMLLTLFSILLMAFMNSPVEYEGKYKKLIKFDHSVHMEDVECQDCHSEVSSLENLSDPLLPEKESCSGCHDVEDDENCTMCHYEDVFEPLDYIPSDILFNHKKHVSEETNCNSCHVVEKHESKMIGNPSMESCYACHSNSNEGENDCSVCHRTSDNLVPDYHTQVDFSKEHSSYTSENCYMCHSEESCEDCHVTLGLNVNLDEGNLMPLLTTHNSTTLNKLQKLNKVHTLDYRFTHGIDARGKVADCFTCHQNETFCEECHSANGMNPAGNSLLPFSHLVSNFTTIGVGTGGGEHAKLARGDIESCVTCHDTQGSDPSCILCHVDPDGVKGTNPSTHKIGFMESNEHGDWHSSKGSVCFNCHTDPNANPNGNGGQGFCGYCHSSK